MCAKNDKNTLRCLIKNRTLDPLEGRGGYSTVSIPAGPIAPIGTQWHVFYLPFSLNTNIVVLKKMSIIRMIIDVYCSQVKNKP